MISAPPWKIGSTKKELPSCCSPAMPIGEHQHGDDRARGIDPARPHGGRPEQRADEGRQQELRPDRALRHLQARREDDAGEADEQPRADEAAHDRAGAN